MFWNYEYGLFIYEHDIANSTFLSASSRPPCHHPTPNTSFRSVSNPSPTFLTLPPPHCRRLPSSASWMHPNAARNARTTVAHRKASTRTPQPQDKPKEGECLTWYSYKVIVTINIYTKYTLSRAYMCLSDASVTSLLDLRSRSHIGYSHHFLVVDHESCLLHPPSGASNDGFALRSFVHVSVKSAHNNVSHSFSVLTATLHLSLSAFVVSLSLAHTSHSLSLTFSSAGSYDRVTATPFEMVFSPPAASWWYR